MSQHTAKITWTRRNPDFRVESYSRAHEWSFDSGVVVPASAAPTYRGDKDRVDPEEALVAALSSCHMLTFLYEAARRKFVVDAYEDEAVGVMTKNAEGKLWISRVTLRPKIAWSGERLPTREELRELHHESHEQCFIASSVKTEIVVEPREA